ncbi:MAG: hypothetical protein ACK5V3_08895 [Bdellovibrionales bacterium]
MLIEARDESPSLKVSDPKTDLKAKDLVSCPDCKKKFQILNPSEGLIYSCNSCEAPFMLSIKSGQLESFRWSEDEIYHKLIDIPGASGPSQISRLWRRAFLELDNIHYHREFILLCQKMNHLDCAREKYKLLRLYLNWDLLPQDLKSLLNPHEKVEPVWKKRWPWILLTISCSLILLSLIHPNLKNAFGAGVLMGILTLSIYQKRLRQLF